MKKIFYVFAVVFLGFSSALNAQEINWLTMNEALELQKKTPKKIIVDVYTNWCGPCKMLDKNTFHNKYVVAYVNEHFYAVKFNGEGNDEVTYKDKTFKNPNYDEAKKNTRNSPHQFASALGVRAYPTLVYFDERGEVIAPIPGYQTPQKLEVYLKMFKSDAHKKIKTQEQFSEYYKNFKSEFK